jgi:solute:Na+ symporter, SSS family
VKADGAGAHNFLDWICGCVLIYGVLFGTGKLLLGETGMGVALFAVGLAGGAVIYFDLSRRGWSKVTG